MSSNTGRPSAVIVFRTFWPTWISVICLEKLRDLSLGPITLFQRPICVSIRLRWLYPVATCQAMRPLLRIWAIWRSRTVGSRADCGRITAFFGGGVPLLIRFRGTHGDKHAVAVAGVGHVTPFKRAHFRPPQPAHEQQRGDHGVESAPALRRGVGFDAPAVRAGTGGGGECYRPTQTRSECFNRPVTAFGGNQ